MPFGTSVRTTCGMYRGVMVSQRWSSERIRTTLGRSVTVAGPAAAEAGDPCGPAPVKPEARRSRTAKAIEKLRRRAVVGRSESVTAGSVSVPLPEQLAAELRAAAPQHRRQVRHYAGSLRIASV